MLLCYKLVYIFKVMHKLRYFLIFSGSVEAKSRSLTNFREMQSTAPPAYSQGFPMQNFQTTQQSSQQSSGVVIVNNANFQPQTPTIVVASSQRPSLVGHYLLSCCVLWCCNPLFGLIAFILAGKLQLARRCLILRCILRQRISLLYCCCTGSFFVLFLK